MIINIPFAGFYHSIFSGLLDNEEESWVENQNEDEDWPDDLEIDLRHHVFYNMDYGLAHQSIARDYVWAFNDLASDILGFSTNMIFKEMTSPREYNFETDRIFVQMPLYVLQRIFSRSDKEALHATFQARFTSCDGFVSYYEPQIPDKPLKQWDHNELGTLLMSALGEINDMDLYDKMGEAGYHAFDRGMDWKKLDDDCLEARRDKLRIWFAADPDAVTQWAANNGDLFTKIGGLEINTPITFRCELTPDLFGDHPKDGCLI